MVQLSESSRPREITGQSLGLSGRVDFVGTFLCRAYRGGHLTIRLALGGCTNRPFYRIVAAHNKCPRDGRFVEQVGSYDPLPNSHGEKLVALNLERIRH
ncbi:28S ribosomal protein S16, mitochondrial, partial [Octodon degus]|uniref:Small ribosomal subunit protein bS16m n=1 Tax=Octodon degus TaxID=10160 RepID=A0A6P6EPI5_OCTDE